MIHSDFPSGMGCYRRNPQHFAQFMHPKDHPYLISRSPPSFSPIFALLLPSLPHMPLCLTCLSASNASLPHMPLCSASLKSSQDKNLKSMELEASLPAPTPTPAPAPVPVLVPPMPVPALAPLPQPLPAEAMEGVEGGGAGSEWREKLKGHLLEYKELVQGEVIGAGAFGAVRRGKFRGVNVGICHFPSLFFVTLYLSVRTLIHSSSVIPSCNSILFFLSFLSFPSLQLNFSSFAGGNQGAASCGAEGREGAVDVPPRDATSRPPQTSQYVWSKKDR